MNFPPGGVPSGGDAAGETRQQTEAQTVTAPAGGVEPLPVTYDAAELDKRFVGLRSLLLQESGTLSAGLLRANEAIKELRSANGEFLASIGRRVEVERTVEDRLKALEENKVAIATEMQIAIEQSIADLTTRVSTIEAKFEELHQALRQRGNIL